jgi:hypothetical protein
MDNIVIPKINSNLYNLILGCARGRWQKNKCIDLLNNGYISSSIGKRNKGRKNNYDYNMSINSLIGRINENLSFEATNIYRIELVNDKYILRRI